MASKTTAATNTIRQNEHPYLKKNKENVSYYSSISSLKKNLYLKSYLFGSKVGVNALIRGIMRGGLIRGGFIRGVTQVSRKR